MIGSSLSMIVINCTQTVSKSAPSLIIQVNSYSAMQSLLSIKLEMGSEMISDIPQLSIILGGDIVEKSGKESIHPKTKESSEQEKVGLQKSQFTSIEKLQVSLFPLSSCTW